MTKITLVSLTAVAAAALMAPAQAQNLPDGKNKALVEKTCEACHELSLLTDRGRSKEDWGAVVQSMIAMGAEIKADDVSLIVDYLATAIPPREKAATAAPITGTASASFKE